MFPLAGILQMSVGEGVQERSGMARSSEDQAARSSFQGLIPLLPALPVLALWVYWAPESGGYFPAEWYPSAILAVVLVAVVAVAAGRLLPQARPARVALLLLAGFVAWAFASLLWAESTGSSWEASHKLLLLLAVAWSMSLLPWTSRTAMCLIGVWSLALAVVAGLSLAGASGTAQVSDYLFELRYQDPVGYANGNAALGVIGMLAAFAISSHREGSFVVSGVFLGAAALLGDFALLSQSRGSFAGVAVTLPVLFLLAPDRLRLAARLAALAGAMALAVGPILDVRDKGDAGAALGPLLDDAVAAVVPSVAIAAIAGLVIGLAERAARPHARVVHAGRRTGMAAVALVAVAAIALGVVNAGRIGDTVDDQWSTLTGAEYDSVEGARISNLDPYERPDYWRVAIDLFQESPALGAGTGNFEREYTARRTEPKHSRFVHNLFLRALGEGGIIGAALIVAFFAWVLAAGAWLRRRQEYETALVLAMALSIALYFVVHSSFDWLEEIPAVASPALALPLIALVAASGVSVAAPRKRAPGAGRKVALVAAAVVGLAALASLVPAYLAVRYTDRAEEVAAADPGAAFRDLERARGLNGASMKPWLAEGRIAISTRDYERARKAFASSLDVEDNWLAHFELALLAAGERRFEPAARELARARALNSSDPVLRDLRKSIRQRRRVDPARVNSEILRKSRIRFTTSGT